MDVCVRAHARVTGTEAQTQKTGQMEIGTGISHFSKVHLMPLRISSTCFHNPKKKIQEDFCFYEKEEK